MGYSMKNAPRGEIKKREAVQCSTCRFWGADEEDNGGIVGLRKCERIPMFENSTEWTEDYDGRTVKKEFADVAAFARDGSGYVAELITFAHFGCSMHAPKYQSEAQQG